MDLRPRQSCNNYVLSTHEYRDAEIVPCLMGNILKKIKHSSWLTFSDDSEMMLMAGYREVLLPYRLRIFYYLRDLDRNMSLYSN